MVKQKTFTKTKNIMKILIYYVIYFIFWLALVAGWVSCVYKFCTSDFEPPYKREAIYGLGSVTGLGAVIGYINIEDGKPTETIGKDTLIIIKTDTVIPYKLDSAYNKINE